MQFLEFLLEFLDLVLNVLRSLLFLFLGRSETRSTLKRLDNHRDEFLIIVERGEVLYRTELRMFFNIFSKLYDSSLIGLIFRQQFINLFQLLILLGL